MKIAKLFLILIFCTLFLNCAFDENRKIEKILAESEIKFHNLYNQNKFQEIYAHSDEKLKERFTEQQFTSYLEVAKNETGNIELKPLVWIDDEFKDGLKRIFFKRTGFSTFELVHTEKAIYREKFEWNLVGNDPKLVLFTIEKICNKPCQLNIKTK